MADVSQKAQKLAAARKKLKEFQQKNVKTCKADENPASSVTTTNSSRHSSISNGNTNDYTPERSSFESENPQSSPLHNYFNGNEQNHHYTEVQSVKEPINFFDNLPVYNNTNVNIFDDTQQGYNISDDVKSLDYPEIEGRHVYGFYSNEEHPTVSSEDAKRLSDFLGGSTVAEQDQNSGPLNSDTSVCFNQLVDKHELLNIPQPIEIVDDLIQVKQELQQSNNMQEAISPNNLNSDNKILNQYELNSLQIQEYELKIKLLEDKLTQTSIEYERKLNSELSSVQERLQGHVKTIEMYIAENNQLSESLVQSQVSLNQKVADCQELQGRLKTSRSRVADLEKELQAVKIEKTKLDQGHVYESEINQLKQKCEELTQLREESAQDVLELREKLNIKANENIGLQRELQGVTHQLSLAQIKIEQISVGDNLPSQSHLEILNQQKTELENKVLDLSQALKTQSDEKVQTNLQYQQYVQQLNTQLATLANKLETLSTENDTLSKREQSLVKHINELEKHLQSIQEEKVNFGNTKASSEIKKELDTAVVLAENLQKEKDEILEKYQHICSDQDDLLAELATKKDIVEQLENELERLKVDQPDNVKLLASIESDKIAASRAVAQNNILKQELEEMQQAFVRMSNDKLELTEQLSSEQFKTHDLQDRLTQLETKLHTLSDAIEIKDNELTHIRETLSHQNKQILQTSQLSDRLRHYEAQDGSSNALQEDLQKAHEKINELMDENIKLKDQIEEAKHCTNEISTVVTDAVSNVEIKETQTHSDELDFSKIDSSFDKEIAMQHLQDKFTRTMADIANLTEEKQRLEHIVMQLQGETDTIGEYIALYQHQRGILQQRTLEKEEQLQRLTNDRINVKNKLQMINELVNKLVNEKGAISPEILQQHDVLDTHSHDGNSEHSCTHSVPLNVSEGENNNINSETADQILQLISEIKSSNLVQPCDALGDFHSCSCCSGQLFTV